MADQQAAITIGTTGATLVVGPGGAAITLGQAATGPTLVAAGARGTDGHSPATNAGVGAPTELGVDGDLYLDTATGDLYTQQNQSWGLLGNLLGPAGGVNTINGLTGAVTLTPALIGAAAAPVTFTQTVGSTLWTIPHTLPYRPTVDVYDNTGEQVWADIDYPNDTTVEVTFAFAATGTAILR